MVHFNDKIMESIYEKYILLFFQKIFTLKNWGISLICSPQKRIYKNKLKYINN